ncbi:phosphotransferase [Elizabethkingia argentiflava]|uniref:Phosphotransferase n=1 Tax=Elizabethkingia argenteiflava TaxID=2681556 RepID=A0A845PUV9_9FLAO|nr:phosphotransferase [Elizabethkingia argenteiflava]NAW52009.1 phosphotransferase [Elizabethkingia argenteiflava]
MIEELFHPFLKNYLGHSNYLLTPLQKSGSARQNLKVITPEKKYILTFNEKIRENECFFYLTETFKKLGLNVPHIYAINADRTLYLQEFVGSDTLSEIIAAEGHTERVKKLVSKTIQALTHFQQKTTGHIDFSKAYEYSDYDRLPIIHDLYYFKNFLVDILEIDYHKGKLLKEFYRISEKVEALSPKIIVLRDFQARNILVNDQEEVYFIDYQSAMQGPATYDIVSLLFQAKANFPNDWKEEFLSDYLALNRIYFSPHSYQEAVDYCKLMRFLQVLGAYGFRGLIQRKKHFIESIEQGIKNITQLQNEWEEFAYYPELSKIISEIKSVHTQQKINQLING